MFYTQKPGVHFAHPAETIYLFPRRVMRGAQYVPSGARSVFYPLGVSRVAAELTVVKTAAAILRSLFDPQAQPPVAHKDLRALVLHSIHSP
jgi:hypothetical protein